MTNDAGADPTFESGVPISNSVNFAERISEISISELNMLLSEDERDGYSNPIVDGPVEWVGRQSSRRVAETRGGGSVGATGWSAAVVLSRSIPLF
jgi:hypothetical protein